MKSYFLFVFLSIYPFMNAQSITSILQNHKPERIDIKITLGTEKENHYLPISIIKGKEKGKTITILAGIHGYEYPPIMAVQQLLRDIKPEKLRGNLVFIPIANIGSFQKRVPFFHPDDQKNLNNAFPGDESGTITQKIANYITQNIIPLSDIFIDIHGGDASEDLIPFACYYNNTAHPKNTELAQQLSKISGLPYVVSYPYTISKTEPALYAFKQAVQNDIVALSLEAGKLGRNNQEDVEMLINSVYHILDFTENYPKPNSTKNLNQNPEFLSQQFYVKVPKTGIFYSSYKAGDSVTKGEELGYITDEFGTVLEKITAPESGIILYKISTPPVNKGETMFCIAQ